MDGTRVRVVDPEELMDDPRFAELARNAANNLKTALHALS